MSSYNWSPIQPPITGVTSLNNLSGALTLVAGTGIVITPSGSNITITATGTGTGGITSINADPTVAQVLALGTIGSDFNLVDDMAGTHTFNLPTATASKRGALSSADWSTFNGKQAAGNYITALTGDATASGPGSVALTLVTVNANVGSFGTASSVSAITVNAKGLVTAAASTPILIAESQVTNLVSDLAGKQATGNYITALTGDITASGPGSVASTLATVNTNVGSFTNSSITVNAKGLVTAASSATTTGSGSTVLATAPTMTNPIVGTQSQGDASTKAASTSYVDTAVANAVAGINPAVAVQAATTAAGDTSGFTYNNGASGIGATFTGTTNTAVTIDGFTFTALGQRLLVKNDTQSPSGAFNGVYSVTQLQTGILPPILTRALDYDMPSDINNTGAIPVVSGTVNGTTSWVQTAQVVTVGTTPLVFVQFSKNPAAYLLVANNLSDVASKTTSFNNLSPMTTGGDIIFGGASGTGTRLANGSSGQVLTSAGGTSAPTWSPVPGGAPSYTFVSQSSTLNPAVIGTYYLLSGASFTITLPTAASISGQSIVFQHNGTSLTQLYTFATTSAQTINGPGGTVSSGNYSLYTNGEKLILYSDGSNWQVVQHETTTGETNLNGLAISATSNFTFAISSAAVVSGDIYSNNSQSFVVTTSGTVTSMPASGTGAPSASGTLTRTFGTGAATLTFSSVSTSATTKGAQTTDAFVWWRTGQYLNFRYDVIWAAGTQGTGDLRFFYPTNLQPSLTNLLINALDGVPTKWSIIANGQITSNNNTLIQTGQMISANNLAMSIYINTVGMMGNGHYAISSQTAFSVQGRYPVTGWQP